MKVIERYEKECLSDRPNECLELGKEAAASIARTFCGGIMPHQFQPDYKETCRKIAHGECKGNVYSMVKFYCPDEHLNSHKL